MMNTRTNRVLAWLKKDVNAEGESNDLTVLLRLLTLLFSLFFAVITVFLLCEHIYDPAGVACIFHIMMTTLFALSYHFSQRWIFLPFLGAVLLASVSFTLTFGCSYGFTLIAFVGIPLLYYNARTEILTKNLCAFGYASAILIFTFFSIDFEVAVPPTRHLIFIMLTANLTLFAVALSVISYCFCQKFIEAEHKLYQYNKKLKQIASRDPLTGLMNRRCMNDTLNGLIDEYNSGGKELSVAIGDIDFFKRFNDTYGHDCGDYVLKALSDLFLKFMDGKGEVCRWGGEEFLFAFTSDNADNVFVFLNDLRHMIKHTCLTFHEESISVTMTFGLEEFNSDIGIEQTIKKADEKLYLGKESGRDKVVY